jgi:hypothetical protein
MMVEVFGREEAIEFTQWKLFHHVRQATVRISVDDLHQISLFVQVQSISSILCVTSIPFIYDARVLQIDVRRRLEIYVLRDQLKARLEL